MPRSLCLLAKSRYGRNCCSRSPFDRKAFTSWLKLIGRRTTQIGTFLKRVMPRVSIKTAPAGTCFAPSSAAAVVMWSSVSSKNNSFMSLADTHGIKPFQNLGFCFEGVPPDSKSTICPKPVSSQPGAFRNSGKRRPGRNSPSTGKSCRVSQFLCILRASIFCLSAPISSSREFRHSAIFCCSASDCAMGELNACTSFLLSVGTPEPDENRLIPIES